jgi:hypothetical protein
MIRTKSVYSPIDRQRDGLRILTTRIRGRGGSAPGPTASDCRRLWAVKKVYHAKSVVQYQWRKGKSSELFTLGQNLKWKLTTSRELFQ